MRVQKSSLQHTYRLVVPDDGRGPAQTFVFEGWSPDSALHHAQRQCRGREAELFEDERSLGRIRCAPQGGYWVLSPADRD